MIRIKAPRDFAAGCLFILIAAFFLWFGRNLSIGSSSFMEAGYFPRLASIVLAILGLMAIASSLRFDGPGLSAWAWRPLLVLSGSVAVFGLLIPRAGLIITTLVVIAIAAATGRRLGWREFIGLAIALVALMVAIFHYGLNLPVPVWPRW
ncbi:MAG: tripartite tricarboxylate transporter TctB family protein [Hyphomicrobiaceae bacterium]|nr:tripartite tricarboxylate transporter TctB family protein [Hyphomicrobiaceae bacterium]